MSYVHPAWLEHQRQRFTKPEPIQRKTYAERLVEQRRAAEEEERAAIEREAFEREVLQLRRELAGLKLEYELQRFQAKYSPDQPRVPAGNPDGGQWTSDAGKDGLDARPLPGDRADEFSDQRRLPGSRARGHHYVPKAVYKSRAFSPEATKVFREESTGRLRAQRHGWSEQHDQYNQAVGKALESFMKARDISPEMMTGDQAREFANAVKKSADFRIRDFNLNIFRRELNYLLRFRSRQVE